MTNCIIIDDETSARELIKYHLSELEGFDISASFDNALDAFTFLQKNTVDLAFIDIKMPKLSGLELIRSLTIRPQVIFTTAFREYAADAFELDVLDYLVKPITQERFMKAISKYMYYLNGADGYKQIPDNYEDAYIFLKVGRDQTKIFLKDIIFIEGLADYIKVHTVNNSYVASEKLSYMELKLPENKFARIHKSFIIALDNITNYNTEQVTLGHKTLPLGRVFKAGFFRKVQSKNQGA